MTKVKLNRRQMVGGFAASAVVPSMISTQLLAQDAVPAPPPQVWNDLADLAREAQRLGLSVPRMSATASAAGESFEDTQPAIIDFMDGIEASSADAGASSEDVDAILDRASDLLRTTRNAERTPRDIEAPAGARRVRRPPFDDVADGYRQLFASCKIRDSKRNQVAWYISKVKDPSRRKLYEAVTEETCVPWFVVGIIHGMECGFDTRSHLHNGDSLKRKTRQVPRGRPKVWNPPTDWVSSAVDAMRYDKLDEKADWDIAKLCYRWESYNGWRSRLLHNINTPYLWSFSNHYTRGKYIRDGVWSSTTVSKQCGAAVMLKALVEDGTIKPSVLGL